MNKNELKSFFIAKILNMFIEKALSVENDILPCVRVCMCVCVCVSACVEVNLSQVYINVYNM